VRLLVHDYVSVDPEQLVRVIRDGFDDLKTFGALTVEYDGLGKAAVELGEEFIPGRGQVRRRTGGHPGSSR